MPRVPTIPSAVPSTTPAVHALVIGVGGYSSPALPGLAEASKSALAFADWLKDKHAAPNLARGSIDVLATQASGAPVSWNGNALDAPTLANVKAAAEAILERVDDNPANMFVFYFCGHGVQLGDLRSLWLADIDLTSKADPFSNTIAFEGFLDGMRSCTPRQQLFVVDACRELPLGLGGWDSGVELGDRLVRYNVKKASKLSPRRHVVLEATSATQKAWAGTNGAWFTDAMLTVLAGAAGDNRFTPTPNDYLVNPADIPRTIKLLLNEGFLDAPAGPQIPEPSGVGDIDFHVPNPPVVPVLVTKVPQSANVGAQFSAESNNAAVRNYASQEGDPWRSHFPIGSYVFRCAAASRNETVRVPKTKVEFP